MLILSLTQDQRPAGQDKKRCRYPPGKAGAGQQLIPKRNLGLINYNPALPTVKFKFLKIIYAAFDEL